MISWEAKASRRSRHGLHHHKRSSSRNRIEKSFVRVPSGLEPVDGCGQHRLALRRGSRRCPARPDRRAAVQPVDGRDAAHPMRSSTLADFKGRLGAGPSCRQMKCDTSVGSRCRGVDDTARYRSAVEKSHQPEREKHTNSKLYNVNHHIEPTLDQQFATSNTRGRSTDTQGVSAKSFKGQAHRCADPNAIRRPQVRPSEPRCPSPARALERVPPR